MTDRQKPIAFGQLQMDNILSKSIEILQKKESVTFYWKVSEGKRKQLRS
jgi:hypothetical protein